MLDCHACDFTGHPAHHTAQTTAPPHCASTPAAPLLLLLHPVGFLLCLCLGLDLPPGWRCIHPCSVPWFPTSIYCTGHCLWDRFLLPALHTHAHYLVLLVLTLFLLHQQGLGGGLAEAWQVQNLPRWECLLPRRMPTPTYTQLEESRILTLVITLQRACPRWFPAMACLLGACL